MFVTRRSQISPITVSVGARASGAKRTVKAAEGSFDQITLSGGQTAGPAFRDLAASLSRQVRTYNTTGKIQELHSQVASGEYRPDARETAARMLLLSEDE